MRAHVMQSVELFEDNVSAFCRPFCGTKVSHGETEEEPSGWIVGECEHFLFAAHDEGYEYGSIRFEEAVDAATAGMSQEDREEIEGDFEELINKLNIKNAFYFRFRYWSCPCRKPHT